MNCPANTDEVRWEEKGCEFCRKQWESGEHPPVLAVNHSIHSKLHSELPCSANVLVFIEDLIAQSHSGRAVEQVASQ